MQNQLFHLHRFDAVEQLNQLYNEIAVFNATTDTYCVLRSASNPNLETYEIVKWSDSTKALLESGRLLELDHERWLPYATKEFWETDPFATTKCIYTTVRTLEDNSYRWKLIEFSPTRNYSRENLEIFFMIRDIHEWFAPLYDYRQSMEHALQVDYSSVYHVNLDEDTYTIKHRSTALRESVRTSTKYNHTSYSKAISQYVTENVVLSEQDYILRALSPLSILERFQHQNDFVVNYRVKPNPEGQEYFELHVIKVSENDSVNKAFVAFRCIDESMNETIRKDQVLFEAQEAAREKQEMISSLADIYISLHYINLLDQSFVEIQANEHIRKLVNTSGDANVAFALTTKHLVAPEHQQALLEFLDLSTLTQRLRDKKFISKEFLGTTSGWCRANFIPVKHDENGNVTHALYMIQPIDEEKTKELNYQKALKEALDNTNAIFREILEMQSCGIVAYDPINFETIAFNRAALDIYDLPSLEGIDDIRGELLKRSHIVPMNEKTNNTTSDELLYQIDHIIETKKVLDYEMSVPHADGSVWYILVQAKVIELTNGKSIVVHTLTNITETKQLERQLRYLSEIDSLTHIKNRGCGEQLISERLANKETGMFCLFDIDNFKQYNDLYGHATGDLVLTEVAKCLKQTFSEEDVIMRLGGDEFAVYTSLCTNQQEAKVLIQKLQKLIADITYHEDATSPITISLGALFYDESFTDFDTLYRKADAVMYQVKQTKKGTYRFLQD